MRHYGRMELGFWLAILLLILIGIISMARGEDCWAMCQPDSWVNIRESPGRSRVIGYLQLGDQVNAGRTKNGYTHIRGSYTDSGEGWVASGYLVDDEPQIETVRAWVDAEGRVACRRSIGGGRRKWLHGGDELVLYASSAEWSVTSEGFVKTELILAER